MEWSQALAFQPYPVQVKMKAGKGIITNNGPNTAVLEGE